MNIFSPMIRRHPGLFIDIVNNIPNPIPSSVMDTPNMDVVGKQLVSVVNHYAIVLKKRQVEEVTS